ncbi:helix-turn-helix transcriptional regulator [Pseudomonas cavernae]|uniref:Helix-turn-helix transcriptional regulator n=1 Tax=Pseudomonas cavernae TaxID=2320867 RepID=A0A385YZA7_9PSED|nr:LuxR C-terminal-related transcriptional regulator [Pseudomonas cavernae]AYC32249.1 helix-turn-helix transcriptional regulator [Pseudomonas cavernae]
MSRQEKLYDELVALIYQCVLDESAWQPLLERLMPATGHQQGTLLFWDQHQMGPQLTGVNLLDPASIESYNNYYCNLDPGRDFTADSPVGYWYHDIRDLGLERMSRDPYYQELYRPFNLHSTSCLKLHERGQVGIYLSLLTQRDARLTSAKQRELLQRLTPHLVLAGQMASQINALVLERQHRDLLLDQQRTPLWLVNESGRVFYHNSAAERRLGQFGCPLQVKHGLLKAKTREPQLKLLIRRATEHQGPARAGWLQLPDSGGSELLITPVPAHAAFAPVQVKPLALVALLHNEPRGQLLAEIFQLTPAERRLAELLAQGLSPEHCAAKLGVSINTVRSQLRALFRKTETERQTELVNLFLRINHG